MPVSLSEWRVRIGKFRCRGWKEYDYNYFWRKLDHLIKRNKRAESPKENNTPKCNTSSSNGSSNVAESSGGNMDHHTASLYKVNRNTTHTGPSCDINNSRGNVNSPCKKDTSHSEALCAENSGSSTAKETNPVPDSTDVKNLATQLCEEDELDTRYITIHQISRSNKKSAGYPSNYTQGSKTDQSDVSIIDANNHPPAAVANGPVLSMESIRPAKEETSNSALSGIEDQSPGLSPKPSPDSKRNAEQTTPIEKCFGSQTYPVLVSGPTSDEADDIKDIDCPHMTNTLLLRSGDVELNPGPHDTVLSNDDEQHEDKDKYHSEGIFDHTGGELHVSSCGLTLSIPPGALPEGSSETITLDVLTDIPSEITLRHDEALINVGFQCLPSGLQFQSEKPAILRIPHCAILIDPEKAQIVLHSMNHDGEADRIVQTSRTCQVTDSHVEISLKHSSKGFLAFIKDLFSMKGKRMSFMPFLPKIMPQCRKMMLEVRIVNKPHGLSWRDVHEIGKDAKYQPVKDDDDEMHIKDDDMEVTCQLSDNDTLKKNVDAIDIQRTKHTVYFELDFNGKADELLVKLKVIQSQLPMDIMFRTHFLASRGISETSPGKTDSASPRPSASTSVDMPPQDAAASVLSINEQDEDEGITESPRPAASTLVDIAPQDASAAVGEVPTSGETALSFEEQHEDQDDEGQMIESVHHIPQPSASQDETHVQNLESRDDLSDDAGMIRLEKHGIEVRIPPNEAYRTNDVTVEPIHDIPPELVLKETEAIITFGLRMSPSNATFDNPVRVTMPHCGIFTKPEAAEVVTYYRKSASESFTAIPSTNGSLRCVVRNHDLDVYMDHFSEIWIVALIKWVFIGKRVICTPYIPVSTPRYANHLLFVHVRNENIPEKAFPRYKAPLEGEQFLLKWRSGGLRVTCKESTPMAEELTTLEESVIRYLTDQKVMFTVDSPTTNVNEVTLHFILKQSTTRQIIVNMPLQETSDTSQGDTVSASLRQSASTPTDFPPQDAPTAAGEISTCRDGKVSGAMLNILARYIPSYAYIQFSEQLGIEHNQAKNIVVKYSSDYEKATRECIGIWMDRSTRSVADLDDVLRKVELGGLIGYCNQQQ